MVSKPPSDNRESLRDQIFRLFNARKASTEEALKALSQCQSHIRNEMMVQQAARECGFKLSGFLANDIQELYYDIRHHKHDLGYVSKGWDDPGFRLGEILEVPKAKAQELKAKLYQILSFCAVNGIALTVGETESGFELHMDGVLYCEGFNPETFRKTLESLSECIDKAATILELA